MRGEPFLWDYYKGYTILLTDIANVIGIILNNMAQNSGLMTPVDTEICEYLSKDVVNIINLFKLDRKELKDYKVIGNNSGTTLVIRFVKPCPDMHDLTHEPRSSHHKSPSAARRDLHRSINRLQSRSCDIDAYGSDSGKYASTSLSNVVSTNMICKQTMTDELDSSKASSDIHSLPHDMSVEDSTMNMKCHKGVMLDQGMNDVMDKDVNTDFENVQKVKHDINVTDGRSQFRNKNNSQRKNSKDSPVDEFSRNSKDASRNRVFKTFIPEIRNNERHIIGMTDDVIFDLNMDTSRVRIVNPRQTDYKSLLELIHARKEYECKVRDNEMKIFKKALQNFRDEIFKS